MRRQWKTRVMFAAMLGQAGLCAAATPTFTRDVAPILQKRCQECHRAGEIGPFPMLTYEQTRPWAAAIREAVLQKTMPPWFADPRHGNFSNDRSLSRSEIDTLVRWVDGGAPRGDPAAMPPPARFVEGWGIPAPDVVFELPQPYRIPATGTIEYLHWVIPTGFTTDKWVQFAEARPGDRTRVHHIIAFVREPGSQWLKDIKPGIPFIPEKPKPGANEDTSGLPSDWLVGYAPGQPPERFEPGRAKLVKAGSDIIMQVHYTTNGTPSTDRSRVGVVFAKEPPALRAMTFSATNGKFKIPAGAPNHEVEAEFSAPTSSSMDSTRTCTRAARTFSIACNTRMDGSTLSSPSRTTASPGSSGTTSPSRCASPRGRKSSAPPTSTTPRAIGTIPIPRRMSRGGTRVGTR
jgi:hypothetical protein